MTLLTLTGAMGVSASATSRTLLPTMLPHLPNPSAIASQASALNVTTSDAEGPVTAQPSLETASPRAYRRSTSAGSGRAGLEGEAGPRLERYAYPTHGHKTAYLFKPLPPAPGEEVAQD